MVIFNYLTSYSLSIIAYRFLDVTIYDTVVDNQAIKHFKLSNESRCQPLKLPSNQPIAS